MELRALPTTFSPNEFLGMSIHIILIYFSREGIGESLQIVGEMLGWGELVIWGVILSSSLLFFIPYSTILCLCLTGDDVEKLFAHRVDSMGDYEDVEFDSKELDNLQMLDEYRFVWRQFC